MTTATINNNKLVKESGNSNYCSGYTRPQNYHRPNIYKMINIENTDQTPITSNVQIRENVIDIDYINYTLIQLYKAQGITVFNNEFVNHLQADGDEWLYVNEGNRVTVQASTLDLEDATPRAVRAFNSSELTIKNLTILGDVGPSYESGIYMENVNNSDIIDCKVQGFVNGVEYYNNGSGNSTLIDHNKITGCDYGIVVAPSEHPINNNTSANTSTNTINLNIKCNKFWEIEVGILGCGQMNDQGGPNTAAGNNFDDQTGSSLNTEWDILWQYPVPGGGGSGFTYYYWQNMLVQPNSVGLNYASYMINGAQHPCNSTTCPGAVPDPDFTLSNQPSNQGCYGSWKRSPVSSLDHKQESQEIKVFPNPFDETLQIRLQEVRSGQVKVTDLHGREVLNKAIEGKTQTFQTSDWKPGTYFIQIIPNSGSVKSRKLLKVQ